MKGARQGWRRANRKSSKKEGKDKNRKGGKEERKGHKVAGVGKEGKEKILSYCNVLHI